VAAVAAVQNRPRLLLLRRLNPPLRQLNPAPHRLPKALRLRLRLTRVLLLRPRLRRSNRLSSNR